MAYRGCTGLSKTPLYDPYKFTIKMYHGGVLLHEPKRRYIGGDIGWYDHVEGDKLDVKELKSMAQNIDCIYEPKLVQLWYKFGRNLHNGSRRIENDRQVSGLIHSIPESKEVEICLEHLNYDIIFQKQIESGVTPFHKEHVLQQQKSNNTDFGCDGDNEVDLDYEDIEESEYSDFEDDEYYDENSDEDDALFDKTVDPGVEWPGKDHVVEGTSKIISKKRKKMVEDEDEDSDCAESTDLISLHGSDGLDDEEILPRYNPKTDNMDKNFEFKLGMVFSNARELKNAVRFHAILRGKEIKFSRNDKKRIQVVCKAKECPWYIWASHMEGGHCIQIKTYNSIHNCGWTYYNSTLNSKWLAQSYMHKFKLNPKLQARYFRDEMMVHLRSHISKTQAIRARKKAIALVQGTNAEEITKLWDYVQELANTQPHTTVIVKLKDDTNEMGPLEFLRMYLCLGACKLGFLSGCRPIIGVDGCHLKGQGGQLLSAVAIDGNNNMFPLAWAMVEGETKATWRWFLELLHRDIGDEKHYGWTFISDKQKGLIEAMQLVFPEADHRFCVRHMHANFKRAGFGGQALKDALWAAATASTQTLP